MKSYGSSLIKAIVKELNIIEADYFGILITNKAGVETFLDPHKKFKHQIPKGKLYLVSL